MESFKFFYKIDIRLDALNWCSAIEYCKSLYYWSYYPHKDHGHTISITLQEFTNYLFIYPINFNFPFLK